MTPAIIWDVDGTLLDSAEAHFAAWEAVAAEVGRPFTRADFAATFGMRNAEIMRRLFDPASTDAECDALAHRKETRYRDAVRRDGVALLPGVARLLAAFAAAGWPQAIGSSAPRANLDLLLDVTGTKHYFGAVVSGDDVTRGKPDPEVFLSAAAKLGVPAARCVVFEDAVAGVAAARAGGMRCVAVTFGGHHPTAAGADVVVASLEDFQFADAVRLIG